MAKKNKKKKEAEETVDNTVPVNVEVVEKEDVEGVVGNGSEAEEQAGDSDDGLALLQQDNERLQKELEESKGQYLRLMAEFDNFRKRTRREAEAFREYASEGLMKALLPVLDDFGRTMAAMEKTDNLASLKEGVVMVSDKLNKVLEKEGMQPLESLGKDFDSELHDAIHSLPVDDDEKKGKVLDVVEKGYRLKDKVIRYAKVVVGE